MNSIFPFLILLLFLAVACNGQKKTKNESIMYLNEIPEAEYDAATLQYANQAYPGEGLEDLLNSTSKVMEQFMTELQEDLLDSQYRKWKWSVREVIQHVISYERIMLERARLIAGEDLITIHSKYYNQATTVATAGNKSKVELLEEFREVRKETELVFSSFSHKQLTTIGTLDGFKVSVRMIALCISGHQAHHFKMIQEAYLK